MGVCPDNDPDLENRDPNNLNEHVKVSFEDVFGEPAGAHSAECVFTCAFKCFEGCKNLCYMILTCLCAIPIALCWGCEFACLACNHIWCIGPYLRLIEIDCGFSRKLWTILLDACLGPICETCGLFFSRVAVVNKTG